MEGPCVWCGVVVYHRAGWEPVCSNCYNDNQDICPECGEEGWNYGNDAGRNHDGCNPPGQEEAEERQMFSRQNMRVFLRESSAWEA